MQTRTIGNQTVGQIRVGEIGLGGMALCVPHEVERDRVKATIAAALDAGVTLIDTADAYGPNDWGTRANGQNETEIAELLDELGRRDGVYIATKGGHVRTDDGGWAVDSSQTHLREAVDASLRRLGVETIDLYQHHRPDPKVPYEDAIGTMKEIFDAGKVRMVGISNADVDQIRTARGILGDALVSVQNQYSPAFRSSQDELDLCAELGLAFLPWSPLGGIGKAGDLGSSYAPFQKIADAHDVSPQQVALAWELAQADVVIPIPGSSRPESITDSAAAAELKLTEEELASLQG
jgi:aryl-alcohol dehydrogenase-like predicted oxidoreductase